MSRPSISSALPASRSCCIEVLNTPSLRAMSMRAECVMLNKGPYIGAAVRTLADIIRKMEAHQYKKRSLYRPLAMAAGAMPENP